MVEPNSYVKTEISFQSLSSYALAEIIIAKCRCCIRFEIGATQPRDQEAACGSQIFVGEGIDHILAGSE